ncbi:serine/threonine protein kinase [Paenibacillus alkalitolerans]|uniref:serine/threonine protein kinase n=1 Tax=Paenibacillus alkalitolerans TaxID=2799335 RepID=UPI0018F5D7C0|nr:serine/threonine-protein kinase [Paenibacillus alkalitolerans]
MYERWKRRWAEWRRRWAERRFGEGTVVRGRYRIVMPLGEGSYGVAYLCEDIKNGNRPCVMKRVQPMRGGRSRAEALFDLEVRMLTQLHHESIPELYEQFHYYGYYCFTMEFAKGASLERLLFEKDTVFSEEQSLTIVNKLLDIIGYVHSKGIVHRDVRIANVIVDGDQVRLIDFGLARSFAAEQHESPGPPLADDVSDNDPMEKQIRRKIHPSSDFYAAGHLLLFLLYSGYPEPMESGDGDERSWDEELAGLHPITKRLLRRMLLSEEQPYEQVQDVQADISAAIDALQSPDSSA